MAITPPSPSGRQTRGGLVPARLYTSTATGSMKISTVPAIYCMFNPNKYAISVTNNFRIKGQNTNGTYNMETDESSLNPRELNIQELWFDSFETNNTDVKTVTDNLMKLAEMRDPDWRPPPPPQGQQQQGSTTPEPKPPPAKVTFEWGSFKFLGVIKSLSIDYVLFAPDGKPLRAKANLKLTEFKQTTRTTYPPQNPSSGGGPIQRIWRVTAGERLDTIAAEVYGDATRWRLIAIRNKIEDPFNLQTGQELTIPGF